jgi:transcription elongation factor S-II
MFFIDRKPSGKNLDELVNEFKSILDRDPNDFEEIKMKLSALSEHPNEPSLSFLKTSKVGVYMTRLKKHENVEIRNMALSLIKVWRNVVKKEKKNEKKRKRDDKDDDSTREARNLSKRRKHVRKNIGDSMCSVAKQLRHEGLDVTSEHARHLSSEIEEALFILCEKDEDSDVYKRKGKEIFMNLARNRSLVTRILRGNIKSIDLVRMSSEDLVSDEVKEKHKKMKEYAYAVLNLTEADDNSEGIYKCISCKSKKTSYKQKQLRSADEPMTIIVTCHGCGRTFRTY